jgi:hypothetical protein
VVGGACSAYGGEERRIQGFGGENLRERDHLGDPGVDGRIILRRIFRRWDVGFWWDNLKEKDHLEDPGVVGRIILRWIFRKWNVGVWTVSS